MVVTLTVNPQIGKAVLCQAMVRGPLAMAWQALSERLRADPMGADLSSVEIGAKPVVERAPAVTPPVSHTIVVLTPGGGSEEVGFAECGARAKAQRLAATVAGGAVTEMQARERAQRGIMLR